MRLGQCAIDTAPRAGVQCRPVSPTDIMEDFLMARKLPRAPSRRDFLKTAGLLGGMAAAGWPAPGQGQGLKTITASHSVSTVVYGQHLVAAQKKFFEEEGLKTPDFIVPGGGAKVVQALAAGQVQFALGDSNHPLKTTEKGRDAVILFATDTRCSYANIVVRKELFDRGVKSVEALGDEKLVGAQGGDRRDRHRLGHPRREIWHALGEELRGAAP